MLVPTLVCMSFLWVLSTTLRGRYVRSLIFFVCDLIELRNILVYQSVQHDTLRGTHILSIKIQENFKTKDFILKHQKDYFLFIQKKKNKVIQSDFSVIFVEFIYYFIYFKKKSLKNYYVFLLRQCCQWVKTLDFGH